ncbi:MAG: hypothetical protein ACJASL_005212 [Paraglaciecola sp.]
MLVIFLIVDTKKLNQMIELLEYLTKSTSLTLSIELLSQGQTLYGKNPAFPEYLERITPDGRRMLCHLNNGEFEAVMSLL